MLLLDLKSVDLTAPQSSALQAYRILAQAMNDGILASGAKLPSERDLARQLGISRSTLRSVLGALADADLVHARPQSGWYVANVQIEDPPGRLVSFTKTARERGMEPGALVLSNKVRSATRSEQEQLRVAPSTDVLDVVRLRTLDGSPVCLDHSRISLARVPGLDQVELTNRSLYEVMFDVAGASPTRSDYAVHADAADKHTAELLKVAVGTPVLVGQEMTHDAAGKPLLAAELVYRGDAYTFRASLLA